MIEERFARLRAVIEAWETWEAERGKEFQDLFERGDESAIRRLMEEMQTLRRRRRALEAFVQRWAEGGSQSVGGRGGDG
ncbi:hypothetical protein [Kyrpidia tusciae]|uniref:Uncharacterized protein n=1 Tax=Kyrpidia tusciae (strain DSM 2912 / NBRC 15312 / T2) TaxID=562970 RepID=D5WQ78_KYRT2|nr:hypothetical protein [Kyrpidia tusciae]ADG06487.1 conserved hypothetical protein [Kyrpidia tusciae DSM 2912]MBE3551289.1 hypothetical protein [Kyrpidia tusciae]